MASQEARSLIRSTNKLVRIALALTLVVAQFLAQAHGVSHLRTGSDPLQSSGSHTQPCSECLSVAPLLFAASAPATAIALLHAVVESPRDLPQASAIERTRHRPFQSRAPPVLS